MSFLFLTYVILSATVTHTASAPLPDDHDIVGWVADPNGRGTFSLFTSCVATLILCVWSAMHLNIPPRNRTLSERIWYNTKWILLGILIPELVILSAWRQWLSARRLTEEMKKVLDLEKATRPGEYVQKFSQSPHIGDPPEWTLTHSLYAGMGGFVFDMERLPAGDNAFIPGHDRLCVSPLGVLLLAKCGCLPRITLQEIRDKSKADGLTKTIVCIQAGWMVVQSIARVCAHQPVTLLEVNTLGHVFCAFIIYVLWWYKPKEVKEPTVIEGQYMMELCAYFYMASRISGQKPQRKLRLSRWTIPELQNYVWSPRPNAEDFADDISQYSTFLKEINSTTPPTPAKNSHVSIQALEVAGIAGMLINRPLKRKSTDSLARRRIPFQYLPVPHDSEHKQRIRRLLASQVLRTFPALHHDPLPPHCTKSPASPSLKPTNSNTTTTTTATTNISAHTTLQTHQLVATYASDWPSDYYLPGIAGQLMGMVLWFTAMCYGAVHLAAWSDFFPTHTERLCWHFSSLFILFGSAFWLLVNSLAVRFDWASAWWDRFIEFERQWWEYALLCPGAVVCGVAYIFARTFLVVDAAVSLRRVQKEAYRTPDWEGMIPHF